MKTMILIEKVPIDCDINAFYNAVKLFLTSPSIVNQRILGCEVIKWGIVKNFNEGKILQTVINSCVDESSWIWKEYQSISGEFTLEHEELEENEVLVVVTNIFPKKVERNTNVWNVSFIDPHNNSCMIFRYKNCDEKSLLPIFPYKITYDGTNLSVFMVPSHTQDDVGPTEHWLKRKLMAKFINMMKNYKIGLKTPIKSMKLIDRTEYYQLYSQLKQKYGPPLIEMWTECTDPQKYVYEDLAIASYLLLLWKKHSLETQKFVDLGCGNGLLVYILASEGHEGTGIDLRKRKIWDVYPKNERMALKVETITPNDENCVFQDADWIIGNHSDELSPWIPVIAGRSSYITNFFLLPCCAYDFSGQKYRRKNSRRSVYEEFLEYVTEISRICGFRIESDRLNIPSTKRNAVIGCGRVYTENESQKYFTAIKDTINDKCEFKPRDAVEKVKNCTKIDKQIAFNIVQKIFNELLAKKRFVSSHPTWNVGGTMALSSVIELLSDDERQILKQESGGLQTLIKNHHNVFVVQSGQVSIRLPVKYEPGIGKKTNYKKAKCWFFNHHPNGCVLNESDCSYKHSDSGTNK